MKDLIKSCFVIPIRAKKEGKSWACKFIAVFLFPLAFCQRKHDKCLHQKRAGNVENPTGISSPFASSQATMTADPAS